MIEFKEAIALVKSNNFQVKSNMVKLSEALGKIVSNNIISDINMPPFQQSAMDGYAVNYAENFKDFKLIGEVSAGADSTFNLQPGECVRIFTGASVPLTANMVIRQEDADFIDGKVEFTAIPKLSANIRPEGEQIKKGEIALNKNTKINPASIGFIASLGITEIPVYEAPKIAVVSTGNELIKGGKDLKHGQIFESNGQMLMAALNQYGFSNSKYFHLIDDLEATNNKIESLLTDFDILLFSGGISVGDYDFIGQSLLNNGVEEVFYKVKQKPGKPLFFGKKADKRVFAIPGNPAACLSIFYIYILPFLNESIGKGFNGLTVKTMVLKEDYVLKGNRDQFLKAIYKGEEVSLLEGQSSAMMQTFALSNVIVYLSHSKTDYKKGDLVTVYIID